MRRVALMAAYSDPIELAAAYNELVERHDYLEDELQKRIADVRVLKKKYSTLQEESVALLWGRLAGAPGDLAALPPLDAAVAEAEDRVGRYALGRTVGAGSSAVVRLGVADGSQERYAVKVVDKARASRHKALLALANEVRVCRACRHAGVARLVEAIQTPSKLYLVLEHGGEDLYALVSRLGGEGAAALSETASRSVLSQVAVALGALERMGVVHHDVKAENVLVGEDASADFVGTVKVTDLGLARFYNRGAAATAFCGSRGFYPPEMALRAGGYDPFRADVWSVGCVAAELLLGRAWFSYKWLPCYGSDRDADVFRARLQRAVNALPATLRQASASPDAAAFALSALVVDPRRRATLADLRALPWLAASRAVVDDAEAASLASACAAVADAARPRAVAPVAVAPAAPPNSPRLPSVGSPATPATPQHRFFAHRVAPDAAASPKSLARFLHRGRAAGPARPGPARRRPGGGPPLDAAVDDVAARLDAAADDLDGARPRDVAKAVGAAATRLLKAAVAALRLDGVAGAAGALDALAELGARSAAAVDAFLAAVNAAPPPAPAGG